MKNIVSEGMIDKINSSFERQDDMINTSFDDIKINGMPNVKSKKEELDDLKNLRKFLQDEFPILEDSNTKGM